MERQGGNREVTTVPDGALEGQEEKDRWAKKEMFKSGPCRTEAPWFDYASRKKNHLPLSALCLQPSAHGNKVGVLLWFQVLDCTQIVKHSSSLKGNSKYTPCIPWNYRKSAHSCSKYIYVLKWETISMRISIYSWYFWTERSEADAHT